MINDSVYIVRKYHVLSNSAKYNDLCVCLDEDEAKKYVSEFNNKFEARDFKCIYYSIGTYGKLSEIIKNQ